MIVITLNESGADVDCPMDFIVIRCENVSSGILLPGREPGAGKTDVPSRTADPSSIYNVTIDLSTCEAAVVPCIPRVTVR